MRKDYYAAHVSQNLSRPDQDAAANGCNVAHIEDQWQRRGFDIQPRPAYFTLNRHQGWSWRSQSRYGKTKRPRLWRATTRSTRTPKPSATPCSAATRSSTAGGWLRLVTRWCAGHSGRQPAHQRCRRRLRGFAAHVLQSPECVSRPWPRRSTTQRREHQGRPQDLRRGSRLRRRVEGGHAGSHHAPICRRNRQPLWRPRGPPTKPGAGAGAQKKEQINIL